MEVLKKIRSLLTRVGAWLKPSPLALRGSVIAIAAPGVIVVLIYFYFSGVTDFAVQKIPSLLLWLLLPLLTGLGLLGVAAVLMRLPKHLRLAVVLVAPLFMLAVFPGPALTGYVAGTLLVLCLGLVGAGSAVLLKSGIHTTGRNTALLYLSVGVLGLSYGVYAVFSEKDVANPALADYVLQDNTLDLPNPG